MLLLLVSTLTAVSGCAGATVAASRIRRAHLGG
jgi:hypothetical protein